MRHLHNHDTISQNTEKSLNLSIIKFYFCQFFKNDENSMCRVTLQDPSNSITVIIFKQRAKYFVICFIITYSSSSEKNILLSNLVFTVCMVQDVSRGTFFSKIWDIFIITSKIPVGMHNCDCRQYLVYNI